MSRFRSASGICRKATATWSTLMDKGKAITEFAVNFSQWIWSNTQPVHCRKAVSHFFWCPSSEFLHLIGFLFCHPISPTEGTSLGTVLKAETTRAFGIIFASDEPWPAACTRCSCSIDASSRTTCHYLWKDSSWTWLAASKLLTILQNFATTYGGMFHWIMPIDQPHFVLFWYRGQTSPKRFQTFPLLPQKYAFG